MRVAADAWHCHSFRAANARCVALPHIPRGAPRLLLQELKYLRDVLAAELDALAVVDDEARDAHDVVALLQRGEVSDVVDLGGYLVAQRRDALDRSHELRAHRAGQPDDNLEVDRPVDGIDLRPVLFVDCLAGAARVVEPQDERGELVSAGCAVVGEPGPAAVFPEDFDLGQVVALRVVDELDRELVGQFRELLHVRAQRLGDGQVVQA